MKTFLTSLGALLVGLLICSSSASAQNMLFWTDLENNEVMSMPLDGSQPPGVLDISPASVDADQQSADPGSLDYDPVTGRLYWPNAGNPGDVSWAAADGSGGGTVNTTANPIDPPTALSLDGGNDRLYIVGGDGESVATMGLGGTQGTWALNDGDFRNGILVDARSSTLWIAGPEWVSYGNLDGTGTLDTYSPNAFTNGGFSVDRDADRLYGTWYPGAGEPDVLSWMATDASTDGSLTPGAVDVFGASSTAIDHDTGEIYWANAYPFGEADTRGIFRMPLSGGAGEQVSPGQIGGRSGGLVILKAPETTSDLELTGESELGSELTCGDVTWAGDRPEAHYFRSPVEKKLVWVINGEQSDATDGNSVQADEPGTYQCVRAGQNAAGIGAAESNEIVIPNPTPVCPTIRLSVRISKFTPPRPFGHHNAPGVRVTFRTGGTLIVSLRPKITFHGKEGTRVGQLRKHQVTVHQRQRLRFLLPSGLKKAIAKVRKVQFAPVTFSARATIWRPGDRDCAQHQNLKLKTRVKYVSRKPGIGLRRLW
ncbi:MAG: hypothetical protein KDB64_02430 [Solirubrobacterales bacterium]|nr:hypothetical protein [Solirubrobacterales bacterium]